LTGAVMMALSSQFALSVAGVIVLAVGMGISNASVFKLVPQEVPQAVGGASGWVGGLGAFGGFTLPPVLGAIVASQGAAGYASGFTVLVLLSVFSIGLALLLARTRTAPRRPAKVPSKPLEEPHARHSSST